MGKSPFDKTVFVNDGKVVYLNGVKHGATPTIDLKHSAKTMNTPNYGLVGGATLVQLEAAEQHPDVRQKIPTHVFGDDEAAPIVDIYYGGPAHGSMADGAPEPQIEPDEYDVWATGKNRSAPRPHRVDWYSITVWIIIILMFILVWAGATGIAAQTGIPEFIKTLL